MDASVDGLCNLLARSRLVAQPDVRSAHQRWLQEAGPAAADAGRFSQWLVNNGYLTNYQAHLLGRGHADSFFLGPYKILDRIGKGRMAGVYQALHELGQVVAIKVLPPSKAKDPQALARFQREARLAMRLKHPNVVRTFQIGQANGLHYLVMEYLDGETLEEVLRRRGRLSALEAAQVVYQALLGLQHLHEQDMVHRDLKPANLMVVRDADRGAETVLGATVKILDIGLGKAFFDEGDPGAPQAALTNQGDLLGDPQYMAPEQARDARAADIRADLYSLGCVLYHVLAGQPPFADQNMVRLLVRHATETPRPLRDLDPQTPQGLQEIVNRMMAKDPALRFPTPASSAQALQPFAMGQSQSPPAAGSKGYAQSYLTWLEEDDSGETEAPAFRLQKAPAAAASARRKASVPTPAKAAAPAPAREYVESAGHPRTLVEFVPDKSLREAIRQPQEQRGVSRRDWLWFAAGAGAVLLAECLGWLLVKVLRRNSQESDQAQPQGGGAPNGPG